MGWKKASQELTALLASTLADASCERTMMFGCPVFTSGGHIVAGVFGDTVFLHLSPSDCGLVRVASDEVAPFEPLPGRPMREYMVVPDSLCGDNEFFALWLGRALTYATSMPPKKAKTGPDRRSKSLPTSK
jgi:hypothetical protein